VSPPSPLSDPLDGSLRKDPQELDLDGGVDFTDFVNYNRDEARGKEVKGPAGEFPIDVRDIRVRLQLPQARQVRSVTLFRPETDRAEPLSLECRGRTLTFAVPRIAVYGVVDIRYGRSWWPF